MNYLSVCSGVEAASQAWEPLGWTPVAFAEIEPFPCAVLASRFPNVPNLGDMSKIHYNRETKELTNGTVRLVCDIDLLVGGTPCQSFSVAGKRAGLEGASGLAYHYARLLGEIQPRWFVWENVPGALSSVTYGDQRDFNFLLHQFAVGGDASLGCRWNLSWRVLDTQYVRVEHWPRAIPQRRRRVFVVGRLAADGGCGCEVLLEPEGVRGHPAPRRVKGKGTAGDTAASAGGADGAERGVNCLTPSADHPQTHRVYGADGSWPTMMNNGGKAGQDQSDVCVKTANTNSDGKAGDNTPSVAIGIGRDAFNSGANAQMAQSISREVQPPITAKGHGGVCVNGEPRKERT